MKALMIGAAGATGKDLVNVMLEVPDYTEVVTFVRRPGGQSHPKPAEILSRVKKYAGLPGAFQWK